MTFKPHPIKCDWTNLYDKKRHFGPLYECTTNEGIALNHQFLIESMIIRKYASLTTHVSIKKSNKLIPINLNSKVTYQWLYGSFMNKYLFKLDL